MRSILSKFGLAYHTAKKHLTAKMDEPTINFE